MNKIYAIGGYGNGYLNSVESFDGTSWTSTPSMSTKRYRLAAVVYGTKIYAIGGSTGYSAGISVLRRLSSLPPLSFENV